MLDIQASVKEAYESLKLKVKAERKDTKEPEDGDRVVSSEAKVGMKEKVFKPRSAYLEGGHPDYRRGRVPKPKNSVSFRL